MSDLKILSRMEVREGCTYPRIRFLQTLDRDIKRLFLHGVEVKGIEPKKPEGVIDLVLWVQERINVGRVTYEGVDEFKDEDIEEKLGPLLAEKKYTGDGLIRFACERLRALYRAEGFLFAEVAFDSLPMSGGRSHIIIRVREGPQPYIEKILFRKSRDVTRSTLMDLMETEESSFSILDREYFDEEKLRRDLKAIQQHYREEGWRDAYVFLENIEYNDDFTRMTVIIRVVEGDRYRVGQVNLAGTKAIPEQTLRNLIELKPGDFYRRAVVAGDADEDEKGDITRLRDLYGRKGHLFARVLAQETFHPDKKTVDVTYRVVEGERIRLGKVIFKGNFKTRDDVLRRRLLVTPGEHPTLRQIRDTILLFHQTKYFKNVRLDWEPTEDPEVMNMILDLEEGRMGDIRFILGYSTSASLTGKVELTFNNFDLGDFPKSFDDLISGNAFVGGGQSLRLAFTIGLESRMIYSANFYEPSFFGTDTSFRIMASMRQRGQSNYLRKTMEGRFEFGHRFGRYITTTLGYGLKQEELRGISPYAAPDVFYSKGPDIISSLLAGLTLSNLERDMMQPFNGASLSLSFEYAGGPLLGDVDFARASLRFSIYKTLAEEYFLLFRAEETYRNILTFRFNLQWIEGHSGQGAIPIYERFFAGGLGSLRGFEYRGIGPRFGYEAVGGEFMATTSLELSIPIYRSPLAMGSNIMVDVLRMVIFYDAATLSEDLKSFNTSLIRSSVGFGFRLRVPQLGGIPISIDFGFPLVRQPQDENERVSFSLGFMTF
jgi:outer membrane protein insertion porin family